MPEIGPSEALFSSYHRRILSLLLLRPEESYHVREISRLTSIPAGSLHRELKLLAAAGLLTREPVGNQVRYRANRECAIFTEIAAVFRKTSGIADVLRDALRELGTDVQLAFIFGSVARGQEQHSSDVDVVLVGKTSFARAVQALTPTQAQIGREVNPVTMSRAVFATKVAKGDRFVARVLKEPKIFLIGTADDLGKFTQARPAKNPRH